VTVIDPDTGASPGTVMGPNTPWSYACGQCGNCCRDKDFIVTPYDVLRLSEGLGQLPAQTMAQYIDPSRPALRTNRDGWCVFFKQGQGCSVHASRPAVCRLYPLGRTVAQDGKVMFEEAEPHPATKGRYAKDGTVGAYLIEQGMQPYLAALEEVGAFLDDAFLAASRAGVIDHLDAAVFAYWTGEGGPVPFNVLGADMLASVGVFDDAQDKLKAHLAALRPLCGLDLSAQEQARLLETPEGKAKAGWLVIATAVLSVGVGLAPGFSRQSEDAPQVEAPPPGIPKF
jgi:Fe-S-cluster containining protein